MIVPTLVFAVMAHVCPIEQDMECCIDCQARFLLCKKNSDSLAEEMDCLRYKRECQKACQGKDQTASLT